MTYNLLIGGAAGQGIDTTVALLERMLKKKGYALHSTRDFMSRIRGGHNFILVRFGDALIQSHSWKLTGLVALDAETLERHADKIQKGGFILCDETVETHDERAIKIPFAAMAKELGNPRVAGSIAVGALLKLFSLDLAGNEKVLRSQLKEEYLGINQEAMQKGYEATEKRFQRLEADFADSMLLTGNQAIALGAMAAGLKFYSAYPMSPSTSILEFLAAHAKGTDMVVEQAEDEIAAINMALGASFAGATAMTGTSGGGFSLMVEGLGLAGISEIPVVIVNCQRPGPATGLPTRTEQSDLRFMIHASQGEFPRAVLSVRDPADAYRQTLRAFELAERYQIPVLLLSDQYLADGSASIKPLKLPEPSQPASTPKVKTPYRRYELSESGISPRLIPGASEHLVAIDSDEHDEAGQITESATVRNAMVEKRMKKMEALRQEMAEPEFVGAESFETLLLGWGSTAGPIREAVKLANEESKERYAALIFGDVWPLPTETLLEKARQAESVINVEQNYTGQLAGLIREQTGIVCDRSILKYDGRQIAAEEIAFRLSKEDGQ